MARNLGGIVIWSVSFFSLCGKVWVRWGGWCKGATGVQGRRRLCAGPSGFESFSSQGVWVHFLPVLGHANFGERLNESVGDHVA